MSDRDYYEVLGLTPRADAAMVDQAYWHLARKYQALALTNNRAHIMLDDLNEAYGVLGTPRLRHQYDAFRDDVLIRKGMIQPVASNDTQKSRGSRSRRRSSPKADGDSAGAPRAEHSWPQVRAEHWRTYATGGVIMALALAAASQGVNILFVGAALAAGLALSLAPVLRRRVAGMSISMPGVSLPAMPDLRAAQLAIPKIGDLNVPRLLETAGVSKDEAMDPGELHASTAAMIGRWRNSVGLRPLASEAGERGEAAPSTDLVEIVESERDLDAQSEPLTAVIDILRGNRRTVEAPE